MEMIRKIDRPPPQVMIQVLIAEITLNDRIELGLEFAAQDLHFTEKAVVGPNGVIKGPGFDFAGGTSLGAAGAGGGFSFTVTGEDFSFLLRALQTDGRAEVLSRPTVMVQNNEKGNITIGDRVPFVRNAQVTQNGQLQSQVEYEDVGIKLDVTPHINPDGYTNLEIHPEISALGASTVPITEGLNAPTFTKRSADTTVTIKDGETIVIGGLITSSTIHRETKVPIIGDIPGLGLLFRTNTDDRERRELLVVLTSRVIWDEDQARAVSLEQRDKTDIIPENVKRNPLFEGLRIRAEDESPLPMSPRPVVPNERPNEKIITPPPNYGPTPGIYGPNAPRRTNNDKATPGAELTAADYGPRIARPVASP
jgi:general secretion pathway protein D